jgi:PAS domain S-box-containing protein
VAGGGVVAVGVGALVGWTFSVPLLKDPLNQSVPMKADTAVGFVALGLSLLLTQQTARGTRAVASRGVALVAIVIGALTIAEWVSGHNLGIDQLLFRDPRPVVSRLFRGPRPVVSPSPGRIPPQTAALFVLLGAALWALNSARAAGSHLPRALNGAAAVVAIFAVIGYGYRIPALARVGTLTPIALSSALTFIVLCLGIAASDPNGLFARLLSSEASGVVAAKRLLPITVAVLPVLGWLQIKGGEAGVYGMATGVAIMVLLSTVVLFIAVLSLTKRLSELDVQRLIAIEREARLATLVDATNDAVVSTDADGIVTSWNRAAEELFGYAEAEMVGRSVYALMPPARHAQWRETLTAVACGEPQIDIEAHPICKDGSALATSMTLSRIMQDGRLTGLCAVSHDITDRIRDRDELERRVRERTQELTISRFETLRRLALAAEYRDEDTAQHTSRVGQGAARLAAGLGLPSDLVAQISQAAPLHDVGKIGISDTLLLKPGPLSPEEFETMKQHTTIGARLLAGSGSEVLKLGEEIALTHHERWDGSGYPSALRGEAIPIAGRIVAVVDSFDAMTNDRPYRPARTVDEALEEIERCSGTLFDPRIAATFLRQHRAARSLSPAV